jgi:enoyl-CoA hydratase
VEDQRFFVKVVNRLIEEVILDYKNIKYSENNKVAIITLNRPNSLNALCNELMEEVGNALDLIGLNNNIHVVILKGSEKAFAAGADIKQMKDLEFISHINNDFIIPWEKISKFKKPIIASVSGYALGGGCEIAMMCDIIIAADNAKFGQPEINLGTIPAAGGTQRLVRSVGKSKAMELVLTGKIIDAKEALDNGLVSKVVELNILNKEVEDLAESIASKSLPVLMLAKEAVARSYETTLSEGMINERRLFQSTFALRDRKEGMEAFLNKRTPKFNNK